MADYLAQAKHKLATSWPAPASDLLWSAERAVQHAPGACLILLRLWPALENVHRKTSFCQIYCCCRTSRPRTHHHRMLPICETNRVEELP